MYFVSQYVGLELDCREDTEWDIFILLSKLITDEWILADANISFIKFKYITVELNCALTRNQW